MEGALKRIVHRPRQWLSLVKAFSTAAPEQNPKTIVNLYDGNWPESFVSLSNLHDNPKATKQRRRVGRGTGSGIGKTCGRGHKGQNARSGSGPRLLFVGGQTPLSKAIKKKGFYNINHVEWNVLSLDRLSKSIENRRLSTDEVVTMKTLRDAGVIGKKVKHGVKVLARGAEDFKHKINLQVSKCSIKAEKVIEQNGGTVRLVYYDQTSLRALLKPESYVKRGLLIPSPPRYIPVKRQPAYDFIGETLPTTDIDENEQHFKTPDRKQPGHPGLPPGTGHIKTRLVSRIVVDYGKKARKAQSEKKEETD